MAIGSRVVRDLASTLWPQLQPTWRQHFQSYTQTMWHPCSTTPHLANHVALRLAKKIQISFCAKSAGFCREPKRGKSWTRLPLHNRINKRHKIGLFISSRSSQRRQPKVLILWSSSAFLWIMMAFFSPSLPCSFVTTGIFIGPQPLHLQTWAMLGWLCIASLPVATLSFGCFSHGLEQQQQQTAA